MAGLGIYLDQINCRGRWHGSFHFIPQRPCNCIDGNSMDGECRGIDLHGFDWLVIDH